jgi:molybdopterin-guanine dinucleotide biosynthesis protein A
VILAGTYVDEFGEDKGLVKLDNKPLLTYVVDAVSGCVDEIVVVSTSQERADAYAQIAPPDV